jgi:CubicO group peptidase (beta-lactamase class C family)
MHALTVAKPPLASPKVRFEQCAHHVNRKPLMPQTTLPHPRTSRTPTRRELLLSLLAGATLAACGGETEEPTATTKSAQSAADAAVSDGLVGVVMAHVDVDLSNSPIAAAGRRRQGLETPVSAADTFSIGSNAKAMTAATAASQVEQGRLAWGTRIADALPELAATMRADYAHVTLEQLLAHQGGVLAFKGDADDEQRFLQALAADQGDAPETLAQRRRYFAAWLTQQAPPAGVLPGRDFHYSNAGYALAAAMMEAATGEAFETLFETHLTRPLGLGGRWRMPTEVPLGLPPVQPVGSEGPRGALTLALPDAQEVEFEPWLRVLAPAGDWACTAQDYAHWLRWHLLALRGQATPLPAGYVRRLRGLVPDTYGLGWSSVMVEGRGVLYHTGHVAGFMCEAVLDQAGLHAAFAFTNTGHVADDGSSWVLALLDRELAQVYRQYRPA